MPTRKVVLIVKTEESDVKARVKGLRDAVRVGVADIEAGRYRTFNSPAEMSRYLVEQTDKAIAGTRDAKNGR